MHSDVFPRSILYCLGQMKSLISPLPNSAEIITSIDKAINELKAEDVRALQKGLLHNYIDEIQLKLAGIHNDVAELYFLKLAETE
jgi:uncharacterized alpha-E superfamily protein